MNCAQVKEQLVDYLYGELEAAARTAFVEHLHGCPGCNAEVSSHERTLGQARAALTGPLLQEPPVRVRLAVMEAARIQAKSAKQASTPEKTGFFARLWRTPWLLPAFGAASVATVVFLVRVLKNPEVVPGQRPASIGETLPAITELKTAPAAAGPEGAPAMAAEPETRLAAPVAAEEAGKRRALARKGGAKSAGLEAAPKMKAPSYGPRHDPLSGLATESGAASGRFAEPPPPRGAPKGGKDIDDLLRGYKDDRFASPPSRDEDRVYGRPPAPVGEKATGKKPSAPEPAPRRSSPFSDVGAQPAPAAAPPPPPATPAPVHAPAPAAAPAPVYAPAPKPARQADKKKAEAEKQSTWEQADMEELAKERPASANKGGPSLDESVKKADRLFASQEWSTAATAYRDLLHRYPDHKDAPKWRERMSQSLVAEEQARDARAAKAKRARAAAASESAKE